MNKTPEEIAKERNNEKIKAAKKYAKQYEGLMYTIGSIAGLSGIQLAFERGVEFGLYQALEIAELRERGEYETIKAIVEEELQAVQAQRAESPGLGAAEYALKNVLAKMGEL